MPEEEGEAGGGGGGDKEEEQEQAAAINVIRAAAPIRFQCWLLATAGPVVQLICTL